jgi:hypothetical protein
VQLYEASTGERLESMELFRARWLFQSASYTTAGRPTERNRGSPGHIEDLLTRSLAEL